MALGATTFAAASALYLAAIERMGAGPAGVVSYCYPVLVMAGAIALGRERLSRRRALALGLAVGGVGLLVAGHGLGAVNGPGALLAFGSASLYTAYVLCSAALRDRVDPLALSTLVATGAALAFAAAHAVHGGAPVHTATAALAVVALALVPTAFAVSAFLSGLGRIGPSRASIASSLEPAVAVACGVLVLGEQLVPVQFLGAGLVIAAVLAIELRKLPRALARARPALPAPGRRLVQARLVQARVVGHARDEAIAAALALEHARPELAGLALKTSSTRAGSRNQSSRCSSPSSWPAAQPA